jgi:16S rRNA processing protein RimM
MEKPRLTIGKIINVRGLQGELKIASLTDFPLLRYRKGNTVYLEKNGQYLPLIVKSSHHQPGTDFVQFEGFLDINLVKDWMNLYLYADKDTIRLKPGNFFYEDLMGMGIEDELSQSLGRVIAIDRIANRINLRMGRQDKPDVLIPFIDVFIKKVNVEKKIITVSLIEGML